MEEKRIALDDLRGKVMKAKSERHPTKTIGEMYPASTIDDIGINTVAVVLDVIAEAAPNFQVTFDGKQTPREDS
ncbi:hypothetical protein CMI37_34225 [Candidatus Pacearchaeota archaeon]|nr:hypothetical protein [Candidatus Pacearchaeota archaeon]|tara:strand:+ start:1123 stop:1344 length:222 start_codon:yes stop_codon:yes gene_type:complete